MFKNLKDKITTQVNKTNQTLLSSILQTDPTSLFKDSATRTSSITSHDENLDESRSRLNSASSDISQTASTNNSYDSPVRHFMPPSDIESESGGNESDHETNSKIQKLLSVYKNKYNQLKNAYNEVERERDHIKNILQQQQDTTIKRQTQLRELVKNERQAKVQLESSYKQEIVLRDTKIQELTQQLTVEKDAIQVDQEEIRNLREKTIKLEGLLTQCKEGIQNHQEKHLKVVSERDDLLQKLNEKQTFIESMMKENHSEEKSLEVNQKFDSDSYKDLLMKFDEKSIQFEQLINEKITLETSIKEFQNRIQNYQETIDKDQQKITNLNHEIENLKQKEQHTESIDALKIEYENLKNELDQTKQTKDNIQALLDEINQERTSNKTDVDQSSQQMEFNNNLKKLCEEKDHLRMQIQQMENEHQKTIELVKVQCENTHKEQLSAVEDEFTATNRRSEDKVNDLLKQIDDLKILLNEQTNKSNQYENELETLKTHSNLSHKEQTNEYNSLKEQYQQITESNTHRSERLQDELDKKETEIFTFKNTIDQLKATIEESQTNHRQLLEQKDEMMDTLKKDYQLQIEKLHTIEDLHGQIKKENLIINEQLVKLTDEYNEQNEICSQLEIKLKHTLEEKINLENELDCTRLQIQTTESTSEEMNNQRQQIKEFEDERNSYRNEIETLKSEIISLIKINEDNTRRIDQCENEKFDFEQDILEKDRLIVERDEKIKDIELTLKQTQDRSTKLREALQKMKESAKTNDQPMKTHSEFQIQKLSEEYEERLKEKDIEFNAKLKAMAKEMSSQIEENELNYNQQIQDLIQKKAKTEHDLLASVDKRINEAEHRAYIAEEQLWKVQEQIKEKQIEHHQNVQDLQHQIQKLIKQMVPTAEESCQTSIEDIYPNHSHDTTLALVFEPTEVDYLKQIILAYMTGTDRLTMAKVICAILRYSDTQKSLIIEHEKVRQTSWLNSSR